MKKLSRYGIVLGLVAGVGVALPAFTQEGPAPGPETEVMESVDIAIEGPPAPPPMPGLSGTVGMIGMAPGMPMPGMMTAPMPPMGGEAGGMPDDAMAFHHGGGDLMIIKSLTETAFSDEQLEKMYQIKSDFQDKAGARFVELMSQERSLRDLLTQPEFDKSKAQSIQNKINSAKADLANLHLDERMSLLAVLTAEQRKELRKNYIKRMDFGMMGGGGHWRHHMRKGGGGHGHGGPGAGSCGPDK